MEVVPPVLLAMAVNVTGPAGRLNELHDQFPPPSAVVVQDWLFGPRSVTLAPAVARPLTVGLFEIVALAAGVTMLIVGGAMVVMPTVADVRPLIFPAVAVIVTGPTGKVRELHDQFPLPSDTTTQELPPGAVTVILVFGVAVPVTVGVWLVWALAAGLVMAMAGSATAVKLTVAVLPGPMLLADNAVNVFSPAGKVRPLHVQPVPVTVAIQDCPPVASTVTDEPAVTVPVTVGVRLVKLLGVGMLKATTGNSEQLAVPTP